MFCLNFYLLKIQLRETEIINNGLLDSSNTHYFHVKPKFLV